MSELELSILRVRSIEALKQKARRGELFLAVAMGYAKSGRNRIEKDPDLRVREAIELVSRRFKLPRQCLRDLFISLANGYLSEDIDDLMPWAYAQGIAPQNELVRDSPTCS
ncbi:hypothetical protein [Mesorhizobium sp.]|uniref:hypothetical protein n=1 Tax=Mesorhizobium sp. TaxID=1871066 RepID=UPI0025FBE9D0|nr:hypothetical protein [Mesorhizobium sp.]